MQTPRRLRDLGVVVGTLPTGPRNAITDVPGVRVGQTTIATDDLNTGVTAIVPDGYADGHPAAVAVGNGYGKLVGSTQVDELGRIETPILLTGTLSVFRVADALVTWLIERDPKATSLNPVVGETNDAFLSDIRRRPITPEHVHAALDSASTDLPAEGCVGAGTGTTALGFKAGIGTSSRTVEQGSVGAIVQSNFSGLLTVLGRPVPAVPVDADGNSCMIVVATDLPLDARQLGGWPAARSSLSPASAPTTPPAAATTRSPSPPTPPPATGTRTSAPRSKPSPSRSRKPSSTPSPWPAPPKATAATPPKPSPTT